MTEIERIESKLDEILFLLGKGRGRTTTELRRKATDDIIRLTAIREKRIRRTACLSLQREDIHHRSISTCKLFVNSRNVRGEG